MAGKVVWSLVINLSGVSFGTCICGNAFNVLVPVVAYFGSLHKKHVFTVPNKKAHKQERCVCLTA